MTDQPVAGWYPDPSGDPSKLRYWDGTQWTNDFANAQPSYPTGGPANPGGPAAQPYYGQAVPAAGYVQSNNDTTLRLIAFILCIVSTVSVCWAIIPLAWMIPMTVRCWGIYGLRRLHAHLREHHRRHPPAGFEKGRLKATSAAGGTTSTAAPPQTTDGDPRSAVCGAARTTAPSQTGRRMTSPTCPRPPAAKPPTHKGGRPTGGRPPSEFAFGAHATGAGAPNARRIPPCPAPHAPRPRNAGAGSA